MKTNIKTMTVLLSLFVFFSCDAILEGFYPEVTESISETSEDIRDVEFSLTAETTITGADIDLLRLTVVQLSRDPFSGDLIPFDIWEEDGIAFFDTEDLVDKKEFILSINNAFTYAFIVFYDEDDNGYLTFDDVEGRVTDPAVGVRDGSFTFWNFDDQSVDTSESLGNSELGPAYVDILFGNPGSDPDHGGDDDINYNDFNFDVLQYDPDLGDVVMVDEIDLAEVFDPDNYYLNFELFRGFDAPVDRIEVVHYYDTNTEIGDVFTLFVDDFDQNWYDYYWSYPLSQTGVDPLTWVGGDLIFEVSIYYTNTDIVSTRERRVFIFNTDNGGTGGGGAEVSLFEFFIEINSDYPSDLPDLFTDPVIYEVEVIDPFDVPRPGLFTTVELDNIQDEGTLDEIYWNNFWGYLVGDALLDDVLRISRDRDDNGILDSDEFVDIPLNLIIPGTLDYDASLEDPDGEYRVIISADFIFGISPDWNYFDY